MKSTHRLVLAGAACTALLLAACGGGGASEGTSGSLAAPSDAAALNAAALMQSLAEFRKGLPADEVIDPATLRKGLPPPDDTAEPTPIS